MVALTGRERSNDLLTHVRHNDDCLWSRCESVDGGGVGITDPEFMHHIELLECDVRLHKMAATAAPGAGSQETEAFEWVMGRMRRMVRSWSLMVVDVRLRVLWTPEVWDCWCCCGCRAEVCRAREEGRRRRRSQSPGSGWLDAQHGGSRGPLSRGIGRGVVGTAVARRSGCHAVSRGSVWRVARGGGMSVAIRRSRVRLRTLTPIGIWRRAQSGFWDMG